MGKDPHAEMAMDISQNSQIQKRYTADVSILIHLHLAFIPMRDFFLLEHELTIIQKIKVVDNGELTVSLTSQT